MRKKWECEDSVYDLIKHFKIFWVNNNSGDWHHARLAKDTPSDA